MSEPVYVIIGVAIALLLVIISILYLILRSPFKYPYFEMSFDVSGKRNPSINDLIDDYINKGGFSKFSTHYENVQKWKKECDEIIKNSKLTQRRVRQYQEILDDSHMFKFQLTRKQTRYKQVNYVKKAYHVTVICAKYTTSYDILESRFQELESIGFECTLAEYHSKSQRKMMTKALRDEIAKRDNYTCKLCGKYMPDGVGLHIDHIVPISKGGKSISSNLQVLCSKCNGKKSAN